MPHGLSLFVDDIHVAAMCTDVHAADFDNRLSAADFFLCKKHDRLIIDLESLDLAFIVTGRLEEISAWLEDTRTMLALTDASLEVTAEVAEDIKPSFATKQKVRPCFSSKG